MIVGRVFITSFQKVLKQDVTNKKGGENPNLMLY